MISTLRSGFWVILAGGVTACGSYQRIGSERVPTPETVVPGLFEPSGAYRDMGFLAQGPPVAFVGAVRFFAGSSADSTIALLTLSLANSTLSFQRAGALFQARYRVEGGFRLASGTRQVVSDQTVRVNSYAETQRSDESVIFQQFIMLPPGDATISLVVRDQNSGGYTRGEKPVRVPAYTSAPAVSSIVPVYRGAGRDTRNAPPELVANPRATVPYGGDTLFLYVEAYGMRGDSVLTLRVLDETENEVWRSVPGLRGDSALRRTLVKLQPGALPLGKLRIEAIAAGTPDTIRTPVLVGFSDQYVVANFEGVLNLLRYFGSDAAIREMRTAPDSARPALWRKFWKETDPNPATPENEGLQDYFSRLQTANSRFKEGTDPGWLTDRGEVFVGLGEPDEVIDQSSDLQGQRRLIRWSYTGERLVLDFVDESGFGRFRLTSSSRADFERVVARVRRRD
jgi:GWxTD domain-containing protein